MQEIGNSERVNFSELKRKRLLYEKPLFTSNKILGCGLSDLDKGICLQAGSADQRAINIRLLEVFFSVFRFDGSAVQNTDFVRSFK